MESQLDSVSMQGTHITPERKPSLTRSQTDSNITYVTDEIQEAPGSLCYITKDGDIDFLVVLKVPILFLIISTIVITFYFYRMIFDLRLCILLLQETICAGQLG